MSTKTVLTFEQLTAIEPRLQALYDDALFYQVKEKYCPTTTWYHEFKPRLLHLVGWSARKQGIIRSSQAYDYCYQKVMRALPDCPATCRECD